MTTFTASSPTTHLPHGSLASVRRARSLVVILALFWFVVATFLLLPALSLWSPVATQGGTQVAFLLLTVACLVLGVQLLRRKAWARPTAVIYHLWLGGALLLLAVGSADLLNQISQQLPRWFDNTTWISFSRLLLITIAFSSFAIAYLLEQSSMWDAFVAQQSKRRGATCLTCGATLQQENEQQHCPYCDTTTQIIYFLQPVLKNARRILLMFEPGHARIRIGRNAGDGEAWIDANENKRYRTISRHHADIELDFKTGELTVHKAFTSQEVLVDDQPVLMSAHVKLGSSIQLGKVQFVLGNSDYEPTLAYFVDQNDEDRRYLLRFNGLDNEQTIGRSRECNIVLRDMADIAHHHATIVFDPESQMFFIRNEADRNPVYIDGHLLEPGRAQELSTQELIVIQLGSHNFNFLPVLYQPKPREA